LRRRETFATSGPRIRVRLFAGLGSGRRALPKGADWARRAYRWGVPMGGNLAAPPAGSRGPSFVVQAAKDPFSGNLDRIQIIKLWRRGGQSYEKIYDVAWSPGARATAPGRLAPVGNTVDPARATYSNTIGGAELVGSLARPGLRSVRRGAVLRARDRDPDARAGRPTCRHGAASRSPTVSSVAAGARVDLAGVLPAMKRALLACALALAACTRPSRRPRPAQDCRGRRRSAARGGDRMLLWGDTHVHTSNSVDAFMSGAANADIDTAYRYARGLPVINPRTGARTRIDRPYDFIVISDHAENLGISMRVVRRDSAILGLPFGQKLRQIYDEKGGRAVTSAMMGGQGLTREELERQTAEAHLPQVLQAGWDAQIAAAERYNEPGVFTAMIGWEWTSAPNMRNLHRVVFTDVDGDTARKFVPFANWMSDKPEDLWSFFERPRRAPGRTSSPCRTTPTCPTAECSPRSTAPGSRSPPAYAARRAAWEPVTEITQYKGSSETHPALAPSDEFAGFELRNMLLTGVKTEVSPGSYVRSALLLGPGRGAAHRASTRCASGSSARPTPTPGSPRCSRRTSSASSARTSCRANGSGPTGSRSSSPPPRCRPAASPGSGPTATTASGSSTRSAGARSTAPRGRVSACGCSPATASPPGERRRATLPRSATARACRWAGCCRPRPAARRSS
jgi:hypothetical protein